MPQQYTIDTLAEKIKKKYPAYRSVDNATLMQRVIAAHPIYQTYLSTPALQKLAAPTQNMGNIMGGLVNSTQHPIISGALRGAGNFIQGIGNEGAQQVETVLPFLHKEINPLIPQDSGTMYNLGRGALNTLEFSTPIGEEALPGMLGRIAGSAAKSAGLSYLQGGNPLTGAVVGGAMAAAPVALSPVARRILKKSLGLPSIEAADEALRGNGLTMGGTSENAARQASALTKNELVPMLQDAANRGVKIDLTPARRELSNIWNDAGVGNNPTELNQVETLGHQITVRPERVNPITGEVLPESPIPPQVPPPEARALKRGVGSSVKKWASEGHGNVGEHVDAARRAAYRAIDAATDQQIPGHAALNNKISNLIDVASIHPGGQKLLGEVATPYFIYRGLESGGISPSRSALGTIAVEALTNPHINTPLVKVAANPGIWNVGRNVGLSTLNLLAPRSKAGK